MIKASIDIGTNTVLLLVAEVNDGDLRVLRQEQRIPRLGQGVDHSGQLTKAAMQRVIVALKEYKQILNSEFSTIPAPRLTATSAVRDAQNKQDFADLIREETGLELEIVSGQKEAQLTFVGAKSVIAGQPNGQDVVIDIGGGSTEIAAGMGSQLTDRYSYDMGCVRFTERFIPDDPPSGDQLQKCRKAIQQMLNSYRFEFDAGSQLVGVAGTVTSLAYIDCNMDEYDDSRIANHIMSAKTVASHIKELSQQTTSQLEEQYPAVMKGRADIFLAGLLILHEFMSLYGFDQLITSTGGIRHGAILEHRNK